MIDKLFKTEIKIMMKIQSYVFNLFGFLVFAFIMNGAVNTGDISTKTFAIINILYFIFYIRYKHIK